VELTSTVARSIVYGCGSLKLAAPHRYSPLQDFSSCVDSGVSALYVLDDLVEAWSSYRRGIKSLQDLGLGEITSKALIWAYGNLSHRLRLEAALASIISASIATSMQLLPATDLQRALSLNIRALSARISRDSLSLYRALRVVDATLTERLSGAGITEKLIEQGEVALIDILEALSKSRIELEFFGNIERNALYIIRLVESCSGFEGLEDQLICVSMQIVKDRGLVSSTDEYYSGSRPDYLKIIRADAELRRRGANYAFLVPYAIFSALIVVAKK